MHPLRRISLADQCAAHLRAGLLAGRWSGVLPGVARLAGELDVSPATIQSALRQLETEGLLGTHGRGRSRTITKCNESRRSLRVGILLHDMPLDDQPQTSQVLFQIQHDLEAAGHEVLFSKKNQVQLNHDARRIVRWVAALRKGRADHKTINFPAVFIDGGSVGPAPRGPHQTNPHRAG